jgi:signal peptidase I
MNAYQAEPIEPPPEENTRITPLLRAMLDILQTLILAIALYFLIDAVIARVRVENISMQPTLQPGEFIVVNKLAYKFSDFQRGDVVVFHFNPQEDYIKRIIGIPGDTVEVSDGVVKVNGVSLEEPYISAPPVYSGSWQVPEGMVFVLGDNRNQSSDSHRWGFVARDSIVGKALVVYWPLNEAKLLNQTLVVNAKN